MEEKFKTWLKLRKESKDEFGDFLCYCGHTTSTVAQILQLPFLKSLSREVF